MARSFVLGIEAKLYYLPSTVNGGLATTFTGDKADLLEMCEVQDASISIASSTASAASRCSFWELARSVLRSGGGSFSLLYSPDDSPNDILAMQDYFLAGTQFGLAILDGDKDLAGIASNMFVRGLYGNVTLSDYTQNQPLEEVITEDYDFVWSSVPEQVAEQAGP